MNAYWLIKQQKPKPVTAPVTEDGDRQTTRASRRMRFWGAVIVGCVLLVTTAVAVTAFAFRVEVIGPLVPAVLIGRWATDHPAYVGRFLEITPTSINLGVGDALPERFIIREINVTARNIRGSRYQLRYIDTEFHDYQVTFYLRRENDETVLRLVNQFQMAWKKLER